VTTARTRTTAGRGALRRVWLPAALYGALPWLYAGLGAGALASALFLPEPAWRAPYLLLLAVGCLHVGIAVAALRRRHRLRHLRAQRAARPPELSSVRP